jgi:hypothetical protein
MWAGIAAALQIVMMVLKWWFSLDDVKKAKIDALKKEIPNAKTTADITRLFDAINSI